MNTLYRATGTSKQAFHQYLDRKKQSYVDGLQILLIVHELREVHPTMGCRDMYHLLEPEKIGRDAFERLCKSHGLGSQRPVNYQKTTDSSGVIRFDNLVLAIVLTRIDQVWVSDITYFRVSGRFYYITFIMDAYSRRILGHCASGRLFTELTTIPALEMALAIRKGRDLEGLIIHSDGGGQYFDDYFLVLTKAAGILNSMCEYPWENGKAERINGVIKNNYLRHRSISTFEQLVTNLDRAVHLYNLEKPHKALKRVSPITFENMYIGDGKTSDGDKSATEYKKP